MVQQVFVLAKNALNVESWIGGVMAHNLQSVRNKFGNTKEQNDVESLECVIAQYNDENREITLQCDGKLFVDSV